MPASYRIDVELGLVVGRVDGRFTDVDLLAYQESLRADPRFRPDYDQLLDLRGCDRVDTSRAGVCFAALRSPFGTTSRRAVIAVGTDMREMTRIFGLWSDGLAGRTRIFSAPDRASVWLGLPDLDLSDEQTLWYPVIRSRVATN